MTVITPCLKMSDPVIVINFAPVVVDSTNSVLSGIKTFDMQFCTTVIVRIYDGKIIFFKISFSIAKTCRSGNSFTMEFNIITFLLNEQWTVPELANPPWLYASRNKRLATFDPKNRFQKMKWNVNGSILLGTRQLHSRILKGLKVDKGCWVIRICKGERLKSVTNRRASAAIMWTYDVLFPSFDGSCVQTFYIERSEALIWLEPRTMKWTFYVPIIQAQDSCWVLCSSLLFSGTSSGTKWNSNGERNGVQNIAWSFNTDCGHSRICMTVTEAHINEHAHTHTHLDLLI